MNTMGMRLLRRYTVMLIVLATLQLEQASAYFNGFEGAIGPEWSTNVVSATPVGSRKFLGPFHEDTVTLSLSGLPPHTELKLSFDLYVIGTWDGQGIDVGPDIWDVRVVGGPILLRTTFSNVQEAVPGDRNQAYPGTYPGGSFAPRTGAVENYTLGYIFPYGHPSGILDAGDSVYHLSFVFPHTDSSVQIQFSADLFGLVDEFWGLDNVSIIPEPSTSMLVALAVISLGGIMRIGRRS